MKQGYLDNTVSIYVYIYTYIDTVYSIYLISWGKPVVGQSVAKKAKGALIQVNGKEQQTRHA